MSLGQEEALRQEREEIDTDHHLPGLMREGGRGAILKDMGFQPWQVQALSKEYAKDKPKSSGIDSYIASSFHRKATEPIHPSAISQPSQVFR